MQPTSLTLAKRIIKVQEIVNYSILYFQDNVKFKGGYHYSNEHDVIGLIQLYMYGYTPAFKLFPSKSGYSNEDCLATLDPFSELFIWLGESAEDLLTISSFDDLCIWSSEKLRKLNYAHRLSLSSIPDYFVIDEQWDHCFNYLATFLMNCKLNYYYKNVAIVHTINEIAEGYGLPILTIPETWIKKGMQELNSQLTKETKDVLQELESALVGYMGYSHIYQDQFEEF